MRNERNDKQYNDRNKNKHIKYIQCKIISLAVGHNKFTEVSQAKPSVRLSSPS